MKKEQIILELRVLRYDVSRAVLEGRDVSALYQRINELQSALDRADWGKSLPAVGSGWGNTPPTVQKRHPRLGRGHNHPVQELVPAPVASNLVAGVTYRSGFRGGATSDMIAGTVGPGGIMSRV
jgi:hypothetical protein